MSPAHQIRMVILELVSEDAHGSWELWGAVKQDVLRDPEDSVTLMDSFVREIELLFNEGKIISLHHRASDNSYEQVPLDISQLKFEVDHADQPSPDLYYWFEVSEEGKIEDRKLRN